MWGSMRPGCDVLARGIDHQCAPDGAFEVRCPPVRPHGRLSIEQVRVRPGDRWGPWVQTVAFRTSNRRRADQAEWMPRPYSIMGRMNGRSRSGTSFAAAPRVDPRRRCSVRVPRNVRVGAVGPVTSIRKTPRLERIQPTTPAPWIAHRGSAVEASLRCGPFPPPPRPTPTRCVAKPGRSGPVLATSRWLPRIRLIGPSSARTASNPHSSSDVMRHSCHGGRSGPDA